MRTLIAVIGLASLTNGQMNWTIAKGTGPSSRVDHAMAYDSQRQRVVLFGGRDTAGFLGDTWEWDGSQWTQIYPLNRPSPRGHHAMVFDPARAKILLFGGLAGTSLGDTWEWDGLNWQVVARTGPPGRGACGLAWDGGRQRAVMFGGYDGSGAKDLEDTWEWDGTTWRQFLVATHPHKRSITSLTYDPIRGVVLLFGGLVHGVGFMPDTWLWDGTQWRQVQTRGPSGRAWHRSAWDRARERLVLFGGRNFKGEQNDSWDWDGKSWQRRSPTSSPPVRGNFALCYDASRREVIVFGGLSTGKTLADLWRYRPIQPSSANSFGAACGKSLPPPRLTVDRLPWLGSSLRLVLSSVPNPANAVLFIGSSRTTWGTTTLPLSLGLFGLPACQLLVSPDFFAPMTSSGGLTRGSVQVPNIASLLGTSAFAQGIVVATGSQAPRMSVSNGIELLLGGR